MGGLLAIMSFLAGRACLTSGATEMVNSSSDALPDILSLFQAPPGDFYPTLMWFWNGDIREQEVKAQISAMDAAHIPSFFIHPMFGFGLDYLSEKHFSLMRSAAEEAASRGMHMNIYDEYNWPSGTAGGSVIRDHPEFRARELTVFRRDASITPAGTVPSLGTVVTVSLTTDQKSVPVKWEVVKGSDGGEGIAWRLPPSTRGTLLIIQENLTRGVLPSGMWSPFCWNQEGYLDLLNPQAVQEFIRATHDRYAAELGQHFGQTIRYLFTDEVAAPVRDPGRDASPLDAPASLPWTPDFLARFELANGYDLRPHIEELFIDKGDFVKTRIDYWRFVSNCIVDSYFKPVARWCQEHGVQLTGHLLGEEEIVLSALTVGDPAQALKSFALPGTDSIFSKTSMHEDRASMAPKFGASVAHAADARRLLCEAYTGSGWGLSLGDMKRVFDWESVLGTNWLMCMGGYYSIAGFRKLPGGSYPPSHLFQRPDWKYYGDFGLYVARVCALNTQGELQTPVAVLFPLNTVRTEATHGRLLTPALKALDVTLVATTNALLQVQRDFDYVFETDFAQARVEKGVLWLGERPYSALVLPAVTCLDGACLDKVAACITGGISVLFINGLPYQSPDAGDIAVLLGRALELSHGGFQKACAGARGTEREPAKRLGRNAFLVSGDVSRPDGASLREALLTALTDCPPAFHFREIHPQLRVMHRSLPDREQFHIVNLSEEAFMAQLVTRAHGAVLRLEPFSGEIRTIASTNDNSMSQIPLQIGAYDSFFVQVLHSEAASPKPTQECGYRPFAGPQEWQFRPLGGNLMRLEYRICFADAPPAPDDPAWEKCDLNRLIHELSKDGFQSWKGRRYWASATFTIAEMPPALQLISEELEPLEMSINGIALPPGAKEFVWDGSNLVDDIAPLARVGRNVVLLRSAFPDYQAPHVPPFMALRGDFRVDAQRRLVQGNSCQIKNGSWTAQGFPDFSGTAEYRAVFALPDEASQATCIQLSCDHVESVAELWVNGKRVGVRLWPPYVFDIKAMCIPGTNELTIRVTNTLSNLFEMPEAGKLPAESGILGNVWINVGGV
jgi:hypothetical protein